MSVDADGDASFAVGVAGADDRYGEAFFAVFFHQVFFAGDFVAGVLPVRVGEGRAFGVAVVGGGLVVGRCGADEDVLAGFAVEEAVVAFYVFLFEGDEFAYGVEGEALEFLGDVFFVVDVGGDLMYIFGDDVFSGAAVEEPYFP